MKDILKVDDINLAFVKNEDKGRKLTNGEIGLLKKLFGSAIDYSFVRIHKAKLIPGVQADNVSMTPWGELDMPEENYQNDFSVMKYNQYNYLQHFFHEMSHVWQYQRKAKFSRGAILVCGCGLAIGTGVANAIDGASTYLPSGLGKD